jgi:hypothetical protein
MGGLVAVGGGVALIALALFPSSSTLLLPGLSSFRLRADQALALLY